jgi:hypothetical protein
MSMKNARTNTATMISGAATNPASDM